MTCRDAGRLKKLRVSAAEIGMYFSYTYIFDDNNEVVTLHLYCLSSRRFVKIHQNNLNNNTTTLDSNTTFSPTL